MQSFKDFLAKDTISNNRSQLTADIVSRIADYKLGAALKFVDNFDMIDESDNNYVLSLYKDILSEKAIGICWNEADQFDSLMYWNDYSGSPMQPTKEVILNEVISDTDKLKSVITAVFDRMLSCKEDKKLLENVEFTDGLLLTEADLEKRVLRRALRDDYDDTDTIEVDDENKPSTHSRSKKVIQQLADKPNIHYADPKHVFQDVESSIKALCTGSGFNAVLLAGPGGTGKSYHVEKALTDAGMQPGLDWVKYKVRMTPAQIYLSLLKNDDKIIVFDDCDEALLNKTASNIFKSALDTTEHRYVSWYKTDVLDTTGLPNAVIKGLVANDKKQRLPSTFEFTGACIFITNLPVDKIEAALLTRCDVIDVTLRNEDVEEILFSQLENIKIPAHIRATGETVDIGTDKELKREVYDFLVSPQYRAHRKKYQIPFNFRLFQRAYTFAYFQKHNKTDSVDPNDWQRRMFNVFH